jgi:hypothetical protein
MRRDLTFLSPELTLELLHSSYQHDQNRNQKENTLFTQKSSGTLPLLLLREGPRYSTVVLANVLA